MTPLKWLLSFCLLAGLVAGGVYYFRSAASSRESGNAPSESVAAAPVPISLPKAIAPASVKRIQEFYQQESARIGAVDPNPELTQKRLEAFARDLKPEEVNWLKGETENEKAGGDGRFFAAYLLALGDQPEATSALREIALRPLPESKNQGRVELERQLRAQATEGLGRVCAKNENAKEALLEIVGAQEDEFLRDRAHRALFECRSGKPVAKQDEEGLRKILYKK